MQYTCRQRRKTSNKTWVRGFIVLLEIVNERGEQHKENDQHHDLAHIYS